MKNDSKKKNLNNIIFGHFFIAVSTALASFFLAYFLKEKGLTILQIGFLFSLGIAAGGFLFSIVYSKIIKRIKFRTGFVVAVFVKSLQNLLLFLFPTSLGAMGSQASTDIGQKIENISEDVTIQHNLEKKESRKISSRFLWNDGLGQSVGIIISIILITYLGFKYSFLIFFLIGFVPLFFYLGVNDKNRFKAKEKTKPPKLSRQLKLFAFSEMVYWLALSVSFELAITFLVTDRLQSSFAWIGYLFIGLYASITITTILTQKFLDKKDYTKTSIIGGIGAGIWVPSKTAFVWKLTQKENREKVSGYIFGFRGFVNAIGPFVGGVLVSLFGILAPFYFKAGLSLIVIAIYSYILISTKKNNF
jgi:MFS family permease